MTLTPKQQEVLHWVQKGLSNKQIAKRLNIAESTTKLHMTAILEKHGVRNRTQLAVTSLEQQSSIKLTHDQFAVVDVNNNWIDAKESPPPKSVKMLMINKRLGVAVLGSWRDADGWTHWYPLPTFKRTP